MAALVGTEEMRDDIAMLVFHRVEREVADPAGSHDC